MKKWLIIDSGCKPSRVHGTGYAALSPRHWDKAPLTTEATYLLTNAQGMLVAEGKLGNPTMEYIINLSKLATGLYTLTLYDMEQVMQTQNVIIE